MTACPNATVERGDGQCGGRQLVDHRGQTIPCRSCWQAAGYPRLTTWQEAALRAWVLAVGRVLELGLDRAADLAAAGDALDRWTAEVRRRGVADGRRDAWAAWIDCRDDEGVPA